MANENIILGGWAVNPVVYGVPQKVATAFSRLMQVKGAEYEPMIYCGSQLVAGNNHMIICKQTAITLNHDIHVVKVVLYETLEGEFSIKSIETIV